MEHHSHHGNEKAKPSDNRNALGEKQSGKSFVDRLPLRERQLKHRPAGLPSRRNAAKLSLSH